MKRFYSNSFLEISRYFEAVAVLTEYQNPAHSEEILKDKVRSILRERLEDLIKVCTDVELNYSLMHLQRMEEALSEPEYTIGQCALSIRELQRRIDDEMSSILLMLIPQNRIEYYEGSNLFGQEVSDKFPSAVIDIEEAGKCFATGRYTACVFHLMRVMEIGVKFLGTKMQIPLASEKEWGKILDGINGKMKIMTSGFGKLTARKKAKRDKYSAVVAHLTHVKDAWRNRVMHPKDSYTDEQAEEVFRFVKVYMNYLAKEF